MTRRAQLKSDAKRGSFSIQINKPAGPGDFLPGMLVRLELKRTTDAINLYTKGLGCKDSWSNCVDKGMERGEFHRVKSQSGSTLTFFEPIMTDIEVAHGSGWKVQQVDFAEGFGVEDLHFQGGVDSSFSFVHHHNWVHNWAWLFILFKNTDGAYVRRARFEGTNGGAVMLERNYGAVITLTAIEGATGHQGYTSKWYDSFTLFAFTYDENVYHGHSVSAWSAGTVITNSKVSERGLDWHAEGPYATLEDALFGGGLAGNGGGTGNLPNHGPDLTFYNYRQDISVDDYRKGQKQFDLYRSQTRKLVDHDFYDCPGSGDWKSWYCGPLFVKPNLIGYQGDSSFTKDSCEVYESYNAAVNPASLYEAQMQLRSKKTPEWWDRAKVQFEAYRELGYFPVDPPYSCAPETLQAGETRSTANCKWPSS